MEISNKKFCRNYGQDHASPSNTRLLYGRREAAQLLSIFGEEFGLHGR